MAARVRPHVFEMFRRGPTAADAAPEELVIELALVKRLVELHGGAVFAHSEGVERGARFSVRMPIDANRLR